MESIGKSAIARFRAVLQQESSPYDSETQKMGSLSVAIMKSLRVARIMRSGRRMEESHGIVQRLSLGATDLAFRGSLGERKWLSPLEHQDRISHMMVEETGERLATALSML